MNDVQLTAEQIDNSKRTLASWLFQISQPHSFFAIDAYIRTQVDPAVYDSVQQLNEQMIQGGPVFVRRVANRIGYKRVANVHPLLAYFTEVYESGKDHSPHLSHAFREMVNLLALADPEFHTMVFASVYAEKASETLARQFEQHPFLSARSLPSRRLRAQMEELHRSAASARIHEQEPRTHMDLSPVVVLDETHARAYSVTGKLRVFDAIQRRYDFSLDDLQERHVYSIEKRTDFAWEDVRQGIILDMLFSPHNRMASILFRQSFSRTDMEHLQRRGSAVPLRIGRHGEIRLYPEYLSSSLISQKNHTLPEHPLVILRAVGNRLEIQKIDPHIQLTVFI